MPVRPKKSGKTLPTTVPRLDHQPQNTRSDRQPPSAPSVPCEAEHNQTTRRPDPPQTHLSLVARHARRSRNTSFYVTPIPRYNHYLLARSLIKSDHPPKPLASKRKPQENHEIPPSQLHRDTPAPDSTISDFIWRFSAPQLDPKIRDVFVGVKYCDPETFKELVAGLD